MTYWQGHYKTVKKICACGCGEEFYPSCKYRPKSEGGGRVYSDYKVGHNPKSLKAINTGVPWNKGLTKDHPSVAKICFKPGHPVYNNWDKLNERMRIDPELKEKWRNSKKGITTWNKGLIVDQYPNGPPNRPRHDFTTCTLHEMMNSARYKRFKHKIYKRDNFTCQECGDRNHIGRGKRIRLECHHIISLKEDPSLIFDETNCITLCYACHRKTDNYGHKAILKANGLIKTDSKCGP